MEKDKINDKINEKVKDFTDKVEGVASILGSYIEHNLKDKENLDKKLKTAIQFGESWIKEKMAVQNEDDPTTVDVEPSVAYAEDIEYKPLKLGVKKLEGFKGVMPAYESSMASGFDVRAQLEESVTLKPGERSLIPTLLGFEIPEGYELQVRPRSGLAIKHGISMVNTPGTIDADYRGEVKVIVINHGQEDFVIEDQMRIAQLVMCPIIQAQFELIEELSETERGEGGFGSTGK